MAGTMGGCSDLIALYLERICIGQRLGWDILFNALQNESQWGKTKMECPIYLFFAFVDLLNPVGKLFDI